MRGGCAPGPSGSDRVAGIETMWVNTGTPYGGSRREATVTAEVRRAGASSPEASVSQTLTVEALPEIAIGPKGERIRTTRTTRGTQRAVPRAGTPGIVPDIEFFDRTATSVSVRWGQPSDGGTGTPLTGFGLKFWKEGIEEPGYEPEDIEVVGPPPTPSEYTKTGMERGARYNFRIHACNGEDSCGYWTNPPLQVTTYRVPKKPHTISIDEPAAGDTSLTINWSPEADTGGDRAELTRFQVRWRENSGGYPTTPQADDIAATKREYEVRNLRQGVTYVMQVRSCNGDDDDDDDCSAWSVEVTKTVPGTTTVTAPGQVMGVSFSSVSRTAFTVNWSAPSNNGGAAITGYHVLRRQSGSTWPTTPDWVTSTSKAYSGLKTGTTYVVKVQACNHASGATARCGDWSSDARVTPLDASRKVQNLSLEPANGELTASWDPLTTRQTRQTRQITLTYQVQHQLSSVTDWPRDDDLLAGAIVNNANYTIRQLTNGMEYSVRVRGLHDGFMPGGWSDIETAIAGQLSAPTGLAVRPLPDRKIRLGWDTVTGADYYDVKEIAGDSAKIVGTATAPNTFLEIDLGSELAHNTVVTYEVTAQTHEILVDPSAPSRIHVVDNPILKIIGGSAGGTGTAEVYWPRITNATSYTIHYRELPGNHTQVDWVPQSPYPYDDRDGPPWEWMSVDAAPDDSQELMLPIDTLSRNSIYGIYLSYVDGAETYVAAREAYVWTPEQVGGNRDRIATYPITKRLTGSPRTYEYRVCFNLFDDPKLDLPDGVTADTIKTLKNRWTDLADQALEQWQTATDDLIVMTRLAGECADYTGVIREIEEKYNGEKTPTELLENVDVYMNIEIANNETNEIIVVNFRNPLVNKFRQIAVFSEITSEVGLANCIFPDDYEPTTDPKRACVHPRGEYSDQDGTIDILISSFVYEAPPPVTPGVQFNVCLDPNMDKHDNYSRLVHEAGHVIGIGGGSAVAGWDERYIRHHPTVSESVMSSKDVNLRDGDSGIFRLPKIPGCSPYALDVMIVSALYRT